MLKTPKPQRNLSLKLSDSLKYNNQLIGDSFSIFVAMTSMRCTEQKTRTFATYRNHQVNEHDIVTNNL